MPTLPMLPALLSLFCMVVSIRHFAHKGAPWNNTWLYASQKERQHMDTAPLYRQTGVVFAMLCALFALLALEMLLHTRWLYWLVGLVTLAAVVYAAVSTAMMEKHKNSGKQ